MWVYLKVYGYQGAYDQSNPYVVWAGWTDPGEVAVKFSTSYRTLAGTWYARPWATSENATRLAAPQASDTYPVPIWSGTPYGYGNKDLASHAATKFSTNSGYATSRFYDCWWPESRRSVMYCPNVYYSSGATDANGSSDAIRFTGETIYARKGWVGVDCSGLFQRCAWLAGFKAGDSSSYEYGRIGSLDSKGNIVMNTWGGEIGAGTYATTSLAVDVTDWVLCDDTSTIPVKPGMGPIRKGDMVVYKTASGSVVHMALVAVPTTQANTLVDHSVWGCRYTDSATSTTYWRRAAQTKIAVLSSGYFKIRRLTTIR